MFWRDKQLKILCVLILFLLVPLSVEAKNLVLKIKTLRPVSVSYVYYTIRDERGRTLDYQKKQGSQSHYFLFLKLQDALPGKIILESSLGKFKGRIDYEGGVHFSNPYILQKGNEIILLNKLTLELTICTQVPSSIKLVQYLFLTNGGLTVRKDVCGNLCANMVKILAKNIIPCYSNLSSTFGLFVIKIEEDGRVLFVSKGRTFEGHLETDIQGGKNVLFLKGRTYVTEEKKRDFQEIQAIFQIPKFVEANRTGGANVVLDGRKSKFLGKGIFFWKIPSGFRQQSVEKIFLPTGKHQIALTVTSRDKTDTLKQTVLVRDSLPPKINARYVPTTVFGRALFRFQVSAFDICDSQVQLQSLVPISLSPLKKPVLKITNIPTIKVQPNGLIIEAPKPKILFDLLVKQGGLAIQDGQIFDMVPSNEPLQIIFQENGSLLVKGKIPSLLIRGVDQSGNFQEKRLPFHLVVQSSSQSSSKEGVLSASKSSNFSISPLYVLFSVLLCFFIGGVLFLRFH